MSATILVVDDEPVLRDVIREDLEAEGHHVLTAASGRSALEIFDSHTHKIEIVLSDVRMADGDGIYLAKELRKRHPSSPAIILISGFADLSGHSIDALGVDQVLPKPYDVEKLLSAVHRLLKQH